MIKITDEKNRKITEILDDIKNTISKKELCGLIFLAAINVSDNKAEASVHIEGDTNILYSLMYKIMKMNNKFRRVCIDVIKDINNEA